MSSKWQLLEAKSEMEPFYLRSSAQPTGHVEIKRHYLLTIEVLLDAMPDAVLLDGPRRELMKA